MKRIITFAIISCILSLFQMNAAASSVYLLGPGINSNSFVQVGLSYTYNVDGTPGGGIIWDISSTDCEIVSTLATSIIVKWKRPGTVCRIRAYNIPIKDDKGNITSHTEVIAYVKVQSSSIGDVVLTAPEKVLANTTIQIGAEIKNTLGSLSTSISGGNFRPGNWVSTGSYIGYFPGSFSSPGINTVNVTVSGSGFTSKTVSKTITVYPDIITGEDAIALSGQQTYKLLNAPVGTTYTWSIPSGLQIVSGQGTSQVVVKHNGSYMGSGYVQVSFSGFTIKKNIAIGVPDASKLSATIGFNNTLYSYHTNRNESRAYYSGVGTILEFGWEASGWEVFNPLTSNKSIIFLKAKNPGCCSTVNILLRARNSVGWSSPILLGAQVNNSSSMAYSIQYSTNNITVSKNQEEISMITTKSLKQNETPLTYELYNINNVSLAKKGTINSAGDNIDISDMPKGIYIFSLIIDSSTRQTMKIAIQ